jgi:PAS domain S-box-containing protein
MGTTSAATHGLLRQIEWRQWGLWASAVLVTLLLTLAIASFALPEFAPQLELFDRLYLQQGVRGLLGLVLLFDVYTVYQQIQINRIRRQLARHDELFRLISENAADMIALVDVNGRRLYNSPAYQKVLGYAPEELQTTSAFEQIHPDDRQRVIEAAEEGRRTGLGRRIDYRMRHKDGTWRVLESTASAIRNASGEIEKLVIVNRDITERTQAGEALRRSEANFRSLVENAPYGICRASADGTLLLVNPALVDILGYGSSAELLGANLFTGVFRDPGAQKSLMEQFQSQEKFKDVEVEWKRKDGSPITVRCSARLVKDSGGGVAYFEVTAEDVTERRLLERRFRQMQKMEAVGRLTGGIAHDFNNLLGVIIGYSDILEQRMAQADGLRTFVDEIKKAGTRAASLTRQLLAFSRQQVLEPKVLDLNAAVSDIEKMLRRLIGEDVEFTTRLDPALGAVKADQSQLEQVLVNLAVNARDAMPRGGKLILATGNVELDEAYARHHPGSRPGRYVILSMTDTGTGMSPETQAHIFEPFFTTKERGKGTGLGLATVYGVIKQSDGYIWVDSELGKGTTFTIYLPRVEE